MIKKTGFQRLRQQNLTHSDSCISFLLVSELLTDSLRSCDRHFTSLQRKLSINLRVQRMINAMNSFSVCVTCFVVGPDLVNMPKEKKDGNFGKDKNKTINPSYMHVIITKVCLQQNCIETYLRNCDREISIYSAELWMQI